MYRPTRVTARMSIVGLYIVVGPHGRRPHLSDFKWSGLKATLADNINLGLDLKGGSHLVMRVKTEEYLKTLTSNNEAAALQAAKDAKDDSGQPLNVGEGSYVADNGTYQITINVNDPNQAGAALDAI